MAMGLVRRVVGRELKYGYRCMSTNLNISLDEQKGVAIMKMKKPPVNSLNLEFLQEIRTSLVTLEQNKKCRGVILTSDVPKIFCAGLDILEMYQPKMERLQTFWRALQDMWLQLYVSPLITIAAINGHSPAGGCLMATACDYRIMAPKFTIGLNETQLGIVAPFWFKDSMVNTVGHRETELALQLGYLYNTEEALQKDLVDKVVPLEEVLSTAESEMERWLKIPNMARVLSKRQMREETAEKLRQRQDSDIKNFVEFANQDKVQQALGFYLEQLKAKSKK